MNSDKVSLYTAKPLKPYHLSVGAVIINDKNEVLCHYYENDGKWQDVYTLMRETLKQGESPEDAIRRGLNEEFAAKGEIVTFLGSIKADDEWFGEINQATMVEKTTLYFLVKVVSFDFSKVSTKELGKHVPVWKSIDFLINHMKEQSEACAWNDINEASVLERAKKHLIAFPPILT